MFDDRIKQAGFSLILLLMYSAAWAQSAWLNRYAETQMEWDRYDVLNKQLSDSLCSSLQPFSQKQAVQFLEALQRRESGSFSQRENKDINRLISRQAEWSSTGDIAQGSKRPVFRRFWKTSTDFLTLKGKDYFVALNPILAYQQGYESRLSNQNLFINTRGLEVRGVISQRLGFYTCFTDNQERGPSQHQFYIARQRAVPWATYYKEFKPEKPGLAQDYLYASGYLDAELIRNRVNLSFGHSRFHIGDGFRSLFLSDMGSNYLFFKLNTRLGKLHYQNLFMELTPQFNRGADQLLSRKYAAMHYLSVNVNHWLNIGLFESVVFGRRDHFEFQYLNPLIFYRSVEQTLGSPDNAFLGLSLKIHTRKKLVFYSQVLLDEFRFGEMFGGKGWWGNKYALQAGCKIADVAGISHLLIQPEVNLIRPYTYTFRDSVAEYSHYNQSLAHPLGANLMELSLNIQYKPLPRLYLNWRTLYIKQGRDTGATVNYGSNIFTSYNNINSLYGVRQFQGYPSSVYYSNLHASYEIRDQLFFDLGIIARKETSTHPINPSYQGIMLYTGLRLNAARRRYDY